MSRLKKAERQAQLQDKLHQTPFVTDDELAAFFHVSVPTIRLDRLALGIPEVRERLRQMAETNKGDSPVHTNHGGRGILIDISAGQSGILFLRTTEDMLDVSGYVDPQYLYGEAHNLAKQVIGLPAVMSGVGNIKYKKPVRAGHELVAKAEVVRHRGDKFFIWVFVTDKDEEVFRAKFIMETLENKV